MSSQATEAPTVRRQPAAVLGGVVSAVRPRQWIKNLLVFAAPLAAGRIDEFSIVVNSAVAFVAFTMAAAGIYLVNDVKDVEADRAHPVKRNRPIAAGVVAPRLALVIGAVLLLGGLGLTLAASVSLFLVLLVYEAVQLGYCLGLKHQPVIELCIVASGFLMRAIAGGAASSIALSQWFLMVTAFGSLFMVSGKRYSEVMLTEQTKAVIRKSLDRYSASYLRFVWALSSAVTVTMYGLWAFEIHKMTGSVWSVISTVPFVVALLRYAVDVDSGKAGAPEEAVLRDPVLQALGAWWVLSLVLSIYVF